MEELKVEDVKALETVPYDALAAAYNKVKPALEKAGEYVGGAPYNNGFYAGDPVVNGFRRETEHVPKAFLVNPFILVIIGNGIVP